MPPITESLAQLDAARQRWSRAGEHWPQGPVSERSAQPAAVAAYAARVRPLEAAALDRGAFVHRLRRLYYSGHVRWTPGRRRGTRLDALIAGPAADLPLSWAHAPAVPDPAALDALHAAAYLQPSAGAAVPVDTGAVLGGLDVALSGASELGLVAEYAAGVPVDGSAGWAGDLASWLMEWARQKQEAERAGTPWSESQAQAKLGEVQAAFLPLELVLGAMDGQALAAHLYATVKETLANAPPTADLLEAYYGTAVPAALPHVSQRFARFVRGSAPSIPHTVAADVVTLAPTAAAKVQEHVAELASLFAFHGWRDGRFALAVGAPPAAMPPTEAAARAWVAGHSAAVQAIAARFVALLQAGLAGAALPAWPRAT